MNLEQAKLWLAENVYAENIEYHYNGILSFVARHYFWSYIACQFHIVDYKRIGNATSFWVMIKDDNASNDYSGKNTENPHIPNE